MSAPTLPTNETEIVIEAGRSERHYWRTLWAFRELLYFLAWRDIIVRYKQTALGLFWALVRPLLAMLIFAFIFGHIAKIGEKTAVPTNLFVFAGMMPWMFFANALSESGNSVLSNSSLITKIYFPRLIAPMSAVIVGLVDYFIALLLLAGLMVWYHFVPSPRLAALPLFTLLAFGAALGAGLWLSALTVKFRDFRHILPFIVQFGFFVSPVGYPSARIPEAYRTVYALNPMVGIIDGFRWAILSGNDDLPVFSLALSAGVTLVLLLSGVAFFRRTERGFADII